MKNEKVKITSIEHATHDVLHIRVVKPKNVEFVPGQATEVSINKPGWEKEGRPFTFVCLPNDNYLEFMIKTYPDRKGVTNKLLSLKVGDELILNYIFGAIDYKGEGTFIAGGAGMTPFISILRSLKDQNKLGDNKLVYANNTKRDIIMEEELKELLGDNFINILSKDGEQGYAHGFITDSFLKEHNISFENYIYLCGPPPMMEAVEKILEQEKLDNKLLVKEEM